jgi:predicted nucleic acid-binding protein
MIVADTNLIAYLLIPGPFTADAERAFDRDGQWIAPEIWRTELLNVLATSVREGHMEQSKALDVWAHAPAFVKDADVPPLKVFDLSVSSKFATFDCYYVVLARSLGLRLVTADKRLIAQFGDVGMSIKDFGDGK